MGGGNGREAGKGSQLMRNSSQLLPLSFVLRILLLATPTGQSENVASLLIMPQGRSVGYITRCYGAANNARLSRPDGGV